MTDILYYAISNARFLSFPHSDSRILDPNLDAKITMSIKFLQQPPLRRLLLSPFRPG